MRIVQDECYVEMYDEFVPNSLTNLQADMPLMSAMFGGVVVFVAIAFRRWDHPIKARCKSFDHVMFQQTLALAQLLAWRLQLFARMVSAVILVSGQLVNYLFPLHNIVWWT